MAIHLPVAVESGEMDAPSLIVMTVDEEPVEPCFKEHIESVIQVM